MLTIIDIRTCGARQRKLWIAPGQTLRIGRTEQADCALPQDRQLLPVHFSLQCTVEGCTASSHGAAEIRVNGKAAGQSLLRSGDVIEAGGSTFTFTMEGEATHAVPAAADTVSFEHPTGACANEPPLLQFSASSLPSGVRIYEVQGAQVAERLCRRMEEHGSLVAVGPGASELISELKPHVLFDWLPRRSAAISPCILLDLNWQQAAMMARTDSPPHVILAMSCGSGPALDHLRLAARGQTDSEDRPVAEHMLLGFEPDTLTEVVSGCATAFRQFVFSKVVAILMRAGESPDAPWTLISEMSLEPMLESVRQDALVDLTASSPPPALAGHPGTQEYCHVGRS